MQNEKDLEVCEMSNVFILDLLKFMLSSEQFDMIHFFHNFCVMHKKALINFEKGLLSF